MKAPPLGLYIHLPWCVRKCPYCDFNSHTAGDSAPTGRYVSALLQDIESEAQRANGRTIESVFLGGGTPSLFAPDEIGAILDGVRSHLRVSGEAEITMEANPGSVECGAARGYRDAGVNRLSIGAQSFNDEQLQTLGRIHSSSDIRRAFAEARDGGFDNVNLDIMHALPGQTVAAGLEDLRHAIALQPEHVSWYQLTLEPNTVFHARPPANLPDDEVAWEMQQQGRALLGEHGYRRYEVSAYAQPQAQCRHNLNYWRFGDYLAVGAGAHGKLTSDNTICRYSKAAHPQQYLQALEQGALASESQPIAPRERLFEYMLNALRLDDGFDEAECVARTGIGLEELGRAAEKSVVAGLIERSAGGIWRPTSLGQRFLNDLVANFLYAQD